MANKIKVELGNRFIGAIVNYIKEDLNGSIDAYIEECKYAGTYEDWEGTDYFDQINNALKNG